MNVLYLSPQILLQLTDLHSLVLELLFNFIVSLGNALELWDHLLWWIRAEDARYFVLKIRLLVALHNGIYNCWRLIISHRIIGSYGNRQPNIRRAENKQFLLYGSSHPIQYPQYQLDYALFHIFSGPLFANLATYAFLDLIIWGVSPILF